MRVTFQPCGAGRAFALSELVAIIFSINAWFSGGAISKINRDKCRVAVSARTCVGELCLGGGAGPYTAVTAMCCAEIIKRKVGSGNQS